MKFLDLDFETRSKRGIDLGAAKYAESRTTKILMASFQAWDMSEPVNFNEYYNFDPYEKLKSYLKRIAEEPHKYNLRAHHSEFEYHIHNRVGVKQFDWPPLPIDAFFCTMSVAGSSAYPAAEAKASIAMDLTEKKDSEGQRLINMFSKPSRKQGEVFKDPLEHKEEFFNFSGYCDQDVRTQRAIVKKAYPLTDFQVQVVKLTERMNIRGLPIDLPLARGAVKCVELFNKKSAKRILELTEGAIKSATQTVELTKYLNKTLKAKVPNLQAATLEAVLARPGIDPLVEELIHLRQGSSKTSAAKFTKALAMATKEGRVHGSLKAYLTGTGRWAGRALQIHNFSKPNGRLFPRWGSMDMEYLCELITHADIEAIEQAFGPLMEILKGCTRSMIQAPPGYKLISADYSQVEARITMWLSGDKTGLNDFGGSGKIYEKMAASVFEVDHNEIEKGSWRRDLGKETVLGCGFGMGKDKFFITCTGKNLKIEKTLTDKAVTSYRKRYPAVPASWKECEKQAIAAIKQKRKTFYACNGKLAYGYDRNGLRCKLPSGRYINYPDAKVRRELDQWGREEDVFYYKNWVNTRGAGKQWGFEKSWGGTLFQNAVQAIAADLIANGLLNVEAKGYDVIFTVHDEGVSLVREDFGTVKEYEDLLCERPSYAEGIPLVAEGWEGPRYKK